MRPKNETKWTLNDETACEKMRVYMDDVVECWERTWRGKNHRYGHDFAAFLGERVMTDFDLRSQEPHCRHV